MTEKNALPNPDVYLDIAVDDTPVGKIAIKLFD